MIWKCLMKLVNAIYINTRHLFENPICRNHYAWNTTDSNEYLETKWYDRNCKTVFSNITGKLIIYNTSFIGMCATTLLKCCTYTTRKAAPHIVTSVRALPENKHHAQRKHASARRRRRMRAPTRSSRQSVSIPRATEPVLSATILRTSCTSAHLGVWLCVRLFVINNICIITAPMSTTLAIHLIT